MEGASWDPEISRVQSLMVIGITQLFLIENEPLQPSSSDSVAVPPLESLRQSRQEYQRLLLEKMRAPDGSYEDGFVVPGTGRSPQRTQRSDKNLDTNNPLSLHDEVSLALFVVAGMLRLFQNPWTAWFASMDLRKEILQDVERTYVAFLSSVALN